MKICGVDPSLNGFCSSVVDGEELLSFLFVNTNSDLDIMDRVIAVADLFERYVKDKKCKNAYIESPFFNRRNVKTYGEQQRLYQQVLYVLNKCRIQYKEFGPTQVKKSLDKGIVSKDDIFAKFQTDLKISNSIQWNQLNKAEREALLDSIAVGMCIMK